MNGQRAHRDPQRQNQYQITEHCENLRLSEIQSKNSRETSVNSEMK